MTAAALRTHGPVPVQEGAVGVAAVLAALPGTTPVGVDDKVRSRWLGKKGPLQGRGDQFFRHVGRHVPALPGTTHDVLGARVLKGAQIGPLAVGQGQLRDVGDPHPVGLGGLGLVEQPVGGAAQPVRGVGRARGVGFRFFGL